MTKTLKTNKQLLKGEKKTAAYLGVKMTGKEDLQRYLGYREYVEREK